MPLYEYRCRDCAARFERIEKASSPTNGRCPSCGGVIQRVIGAPSLQFKGSGWYVNDYGKGHRLGTPDAAKPANDSGHTAVTENPKSARPKTTSDSKVA